MSIPQQVYHASASVVMPTAAVRPRESSRSSRRKAGSTAPLVILGGGAGMLGAVGSARSNAGSSKEQLPISPVFYTTPTHSPIPTLPQVPVHLPSTSASSTHAASSATRNADQRRISPPVVSSSRHSTAPMPFSIADTRSDQSLSTTASTSSRTLKTPHSKLEPWQSPAIASSSESYDDHSSPTAVMAPRRSKGSMEPRSPTPTQSRGPYEGRSSSDRPFRERLPPPSLTRAPLPPTPTDATLPSKSEATVFSQSSEASNRPRQPAPAPLAIKHENRLSRDWIAVNIPEPSHSDQMRAKSTSPLLPEPSFSQRQPVRLPPATMIPVKQTISPQRPGFGRAVTAPALSPERRSQEGRASLDRTRHLVPVALNVRQSSHSTPPAAVLDAAASQANRHEPFTDRPVRNAPPLRSPEDVVRPSIDTMRDGMTRKDLKAVQKEQQRGLGILNGIDYGLPVVEAERKSSGLSLKKSTGALKALFNRGASGKGKERSETPPMPMPDERSKMRSRPSTAPSLTEGRPRPSFGRQRKPGSPTPALVTTTTKGEATNGPGRSSLSVDRSLHAAPPMFRAASQGSHPMMALPTKAALPSRDLPPLPPPSPIPPPDTRSTQSTLAEALPTSSLPYLSPLRASFLLEQPDRNPLLALAGVSPASSSASTTRPETFLESREISPIKPSRSLHLLQLPDLDLDLGVTFDRIGMSPSTPRRPSPRLSPQMKPSPNSPSPQRAGVPRTSAEESPQISKVASERRRSKSFDGPGSGSDMWGIDAAKFFVSSTSSSAPMLSQPALQLVLPEQGPPTPPKDVTPAPTVKHHAYTQSFSSQPSAPSSSDHARTPSNASSTNETPSPSPPRTPRTEEKSFAELGFDDFGLPSNTPTPTPAAPSLAEQGGILAKAFMTDEPPSIPLPAVPTSAKPQPPAPAPSAVIEAAQPFEPEKAVAKGPRENKRVLVNRSRVVSATNTVTNKALGREFELLLYSFRYPSGSTPAAERANYIREDLLPLLLEIEVRPHDPHDEPGSASLREACFAWADALLQELRVEQAANERGACLEGLATVLESSSLSERALRRSPAHRERFTGLMMRGMSFVMGKLGAKGVFHNTLLFSGRFLAFAFFRVPHVGEQLVTVLQPPRGALMRFTRAALLGRPIPPVAQPQYPKHLLPLCFDDSRNYTARLASLAAEFNTEKERDAFLFQPGNWLRRWQSDDSELFPAFYRAYHRQLAQYLAPAVEYYESQDRPIPASVLLRAPGYAHLATIFAKKCHSYILGSVNAVTTSSSAQNFDVTETAGFRGSQKPAVLETANRRLVETLSTFAGLRVLIPDTNSRVIECDGTQLWTDIIDHWTKNLIGKTSLYAPKGVFSLFDLLDGIVDPPSDPKTGERCLTGQSLLDVPNLIYVIRMILTEGEHALTLVKVIAFVFTHWEVLTARPDDRKELCLELLLDRKLFERLLLFWSQSVRSYVLRLVVFRLGHLHTKKDDGVAHEVEIESVRLLQTRLDRIKARHDELEPQAASDTRDLDIPLTPGDGGLPRSRSTITMVTESPRRGSVAKAERLLGLGLGTEVDDGTNRIGKATNWLKKSFTTKKKRKGDSRGGTPEIGGSRSPSIDESSPVMPCTSPVIPFTSSPALKQTPKLLESPELHAPGLSHDNKRMSSSVIPSDTRKAKPPTILTTSPVVPAPASPGSFAFEFELPTVSPRSDTFDPTPTPTPGSPRRTSQPPSPRQPTSPHMSKSFSKRSSLLPPSTASALEAALSAKVPPIPPVQEKGYDQKLHAYAIRMLAELEDAQKEYDEWWSDGGVGRVDGAPPRLTVSWPFHEGED